MTQEEYLLLFEKYLSGNATSEEIDRIMAYRDNFELIRSSDFEWVEDPQVIEERILSRIEQSTDISKKRIVTRWWFAAAAVLIFVSSTVFYYKNYFSDKNLRASNNKVNIKNDILPGKNKAILTLSDGKKIILNDVKNGVIANQGNITISKANGKLQYIVSAKLNNEQVGNTLNTITIPKGGQFMIVLPDSTKVWLNSASSLKFPTAFSKTERLVELTGEGYFEVAKNKNKPFKVKSKNQEVEVLGTHFNIMAYNDDSESITTLLEGSVKISKNNIKQILKPGQQAISADQSSGFKVQMADMAEVTAWRDGYFMFHDAPIQSIMKQAARWYDVEIAYQPGLEDKRFGGRISKYTNISELLTNLELTQIIHFKIEGRRVTVMK